MIREGRGSQPFLSFLLVLSPSISVRSSGNVQRGLARVGLGIHEGRSWL